MALYANDCIHLHHNAFLTKLPHPYEIASPRYAEGFWCNIPVDTLACSEQLTVVCWFLPSEIPDCSAGSCDGNDRWYCSHAGKSTRRCSDGAWNRQVSELDMQKMISNTCFTEVWVALRKRLKALRRFFIVIRAAHVRQHVKQNESMVVCLENTWCLLVLKSFFVYFFPSLILRLLLFPRHSYCDYCFSRHSYCD